MHCSKCSGSRSWWKCLLSVQLLGLEHTPQPSGDEGLHWAYGPWGQVDWASCGCWTHGRIICMGQWVCLRCKPGVCAGPKKTIRARVQEEGLHWESGAGSRNESEWGLSRSEESGLGGRLWKRRCPGPFIGVGSSKPVSLKTQGWAGEGPAKMKNKFI